MFQIETRCIAHGEPGWSALSFSFEDLTTQVEAHLMECQAPLITMFLSVPRGSVVRAAGASTTPEHGNQG